MALLNQKISASTLMETLVATVLILAIFVIASLTLNHNFKLMIIGNQFHIENTMSRLQYYQRHGALELPYEEHPEHVDILVYRTVIDDIPYVVYSAKKHNSGKEILKIKIDE